MSQKIKRYPAEQARPQYELPPRCRQGWPVVVETNGKLYNCQFRYQEGRNIGDPDKNQPFQLGYSSGCYEYLSLVGVQERVCMYNDSHQYPTGFRPKVPNRSVASAEATGEEEKETELEEEQWFTQLRMGNWEQGSAGDEVRVLVQEQRAREGSLQRQPLLQQLRQTQMQEKEQNRNAAFARIEEERKVKQDQDAAAFAALGIDCRFKPKGEPLPWRDPADRATVTARKKKMKKKKEKKKKKRRRT